MEEVGQGKEKEVRKMKQLRGWRERGPSMVANSNDDYELEENLHSGYALN